MVAISADCSIDSPAQQMVRRSSRTTPIAKPVPGEGA